MDKFVVNIIHRPEMVPEYAEKVTGHGKEEDIGRKSLLTESLDIFRFQQETAHKNGLKTTIQMTYASLFNEEAIQIAKEDHEKYGDEIALSLLGLPCTEFREKYKTKDFCIWMFSMEDKKSIVDDVFGKFYDIFGFYPESTGSYYMDAELTNYIKEKYPSVKCAIATCWEEGPKAYHTCNNSWYTLFDGGPWNPWIPSKQNTHAPAANEAEDSGIVAIPHLSRDLLACYDGNGSNFGTHPQNVLRGMIYDTKTWEYPYLYNLVDQYRALEKYNNGYAYNMMFVGPGWLNKMGRWEAPYELLKKSYEDGMAYYGQLKKEGKLDDMTMAEFLGQLTGGGSMASPIPERVISYKLFASDVEMTAPAAGATLPSSGESEDIHHRNIGKISVKKGERLYLPLESAESTYERIVEWTINDRRDNWGRPINFSSMKEYNGELWDAVSFRNPFKSPIITAPIEITDGGKFLGQTTIGWTNPEQKNILRITKAMTVTGQVTENEIAKTSLKEGKASSSLAKSEPRETVRIGSDNYWKQEIEGVLALKNYRKTNAKAVIKLQFSGDLISAEGNPSKQLVPQGYNSVNPRNELTWETVVKADQELKIRYRYSVLVRY